MNANEFIEVVNQYKGNIKQKDNEIIFYSNNYLNRLYNEFNEETKVYELKSKKVKVYCELSFNINNCSLNGYEDTCEIIGGFDFPNATKEMLLKELDRYNFKKKEYESFLLF